MYKAIDFYLDLPGGEAYYKRILGRYCLGGGPVTHAGYRVHFGERIANQIGTSIAALDAAVAADGERGFMQAIESAVAKTGTQPIDSFIGELDALGIECGFTATHDHNNQDTASVCSRYPDRLRGFAYIDPKKRMEGVRELEYCVKELKLSALYISSFRTGVVANDRLCYPLYAKAAELKIPVFIYCAMNYSSAIPMEIGHPRYVDDVARDFPELRIMASVSGWPWVYEMIGLGMRHANVWLNLEVFPYANMAVPGSGFEPFLYAAEHKIPDKICFASNWAVQAIPLSDLIRQVDDLPISDGAKRRILYDNAKKFME